MRDTSGCRKRRVTCRTVYIYLFHPISCFQSPPSGSADSTAVVPQTQLTITTLGLSVTGSSAPGCRFTRAVAAPPSDRSLIARSSA